MLDIAIIGAGPYGLSLAAHLKKTNARFRIFGKPMHAWRAQMPAGMLLKSDGNSSDLPSPNNALTYERFCNEQGRPFNDEQVISVEDFVAYGIKFQSRLVPETEPEEVVSIELDGGVYNLHLSNQEVVRARQVVVAVGVYHFRYLPPVLAALPPEFCTHSGEYGQLGKFRGKKIAVIGSGASAIDTALALVDAGAEPTIISRRTSIRYQGNPGSTKPSLRSRFPFIMRNRVLGRIWTVLSRLRHPNSGIGGGWKIKLYADAPQIVHAFPAALRARIVRTTLGPAPGYTTRKRIDGRVPILFNQTPHTAAVVNDKVSLTLQAHDGSMSNLEFDHVIGATGYRTDLKRLSFLSETLRQKIRVFEEAPVLSRWFESSSPGLYFIGQAAAMSFGPVMRFVYGAGFTMKIIVIRLLKSCASSVPEQAAALSDTSNQTS